MSEVVPHTLDLRHIAACREGERDTQQTNKQKTQQRKRRKPAVGNNGTMTMNLVHKGKQDTRLMVAEIPGRKGNLEACRGIKTMKQDSQT